MLMCFLISILLIIFLKNTSDLQKRRTDAQLISFVYETEPSQAKQSFGSC